MISITVPGREFWNEAIEEFVETEEMVLDFEHSLKSVSDWESKYQKPFLSDDKLTKEEMADYFSMMCLNRPTDPLVFYNLPNDSVKKLTDYILSSRSATVIREKKIEGQGRIKETLTSEKIYSWMVGLQIPFECENWHLNRLINLVKLCDQNNKAANGGGKKTSRKDLSKKYSSLNAARRAALHTKG